MPPAALISLTAMSIMILAVMPDAAPAPLSPTDTPTRMVGGRPCACTSPACKPSTRAAAVSSPRLAFPLDCIYPSLLSRRLFSNPVAPADAVEAFAQLPDTARSVDPGAVRQAGREVLDLDHLRVDGDKFAGLDVAVGQVPFAVALGVKP